MDDMKEEISQRLLSVAQRRMTVGDNAYPTENWSSSSKELVEQMMTRSKSESFGLGRRPKRMSPARELFNDSFSECQKCAGVQEKAAKDKKKYFLEVEHLRRGITKCLDHLASTMTAGNLEALKNSLQLDVHFFSGPDGEENNQEGQKEKELKPIQVNASGLQAKQEELDRMEKVVAKLEEEINALEKENARLQKEVALAEIAARRASTAKTLHVQSQTDAGMGPGQIPGRPDGGGPGGGGGVAGGGASPWDSPAYGGQQNGNYHPRPGEVPGNGSGGGAGPSVPGGSGHYGGTGSGVAGQGPHGNAATSGGIDSSHLAEMERLKQELEKTKRKLRGAERELRRRSDGAGGAEDGQQSGGEDGASGAGDNVATQEGSAAVAGKDRRGSAAAQGSSSTGGKRGTQSYGDSGGGGASASGGTSSSSGGGKSKSTRGKGDTYSGSGTTTGAAGIGGGRRADGTAASGDADSPEGAADGEQEVTLLGARVAPETADKCVGNGPGPGLAEEPVRCSGKKIAPPKEMNKAGITFARRLRSQPTIAGLTASLSSFEGLMESLDANDDSNAVRRAARTAGASTASAAIEAFHELGAASKTWPGIPSAHAASGEFGSIHSRASASGLPASGECGRLPRSASTSGLPVAGEFGGISRSTTSSLAALPAGRATLASTQPLNRSAEPYLMHVWEQKKPLQRAKIAQELEKLGAMTPLALVPLSQIPLQEK